MERFKSGRLTLEIDSADAATPAMVYMGVYSCTYDLAVAVGTVNDVVSLTRNELAWLEGFADKVEEAFQQARAGNPEYT